MIYFKDRRFLSIFFIQESSAVIYNVNLKNIHYVRACNCYKP